MQAEHVGQIRELINTSPLLSDAERKEWVSLLELMNDKQLLELEKILTSAVPHVAVPPVKPAAASVQPAVKPVVPPAAQPEKKPAPAGPVPPAAGSPLHLSHILNIPKTPLRAPGAPARPEAHKPQDTFKQALTHAIEEKELPKGEIPEELPEHATADAVSPVPKPVPAPSVPPLEKIVKFPEKEPAAPAKPAEIPGPEKAVAEPVPPAAIPAVKKPVRDEAVFTPGLNNPKLILSAQLAQASRRAEEQKQPMRPPTAPHAAPPSAQHDIPQLGSLDQVNKLQPKDWKIAYAPAFLKSFHKLIKEFGYHDVMFSFEKSPLYKAYVDTGLTILKNQIDFAELAKENTDAQRTFLTREDFESLADTLRQLPV